MKNTLFLLCFLAFSLPATGQKPRLLVTTDLGADPDDQQSLVRLMVYSNEFEIEGIIVSSNGTKGDLKEGQIKPEFATEILRGYQSVYPNLLLHDQHFPSPESLFAVLKNGNPNRGWEYVGAGYDTEGSEWIIRHLDKKDSRPLNICFFGGQTDLAQALWKLKASRSVGEYQQIISKIRIFDINDQDQLFEKIIAQHPGLFYILAKAPDGFDKREGAYRGMYLGGDESLTSGAWLKANVIENHGPLGALYPVNTWTAPNPHGAMKEGDTPSWFYFLENGLHVPEHPEYGSWGGRYQKTKNGYYRDAQDSLNSEPKARATVYRWRDDYQRDFAARMDWCVLDYANANHQPIAIVNGHSENSPLEIHAQPGQKVRLRASKSRDPDGDSLHFEWMLYPEAGNFQGNIPLPLGAEKATFKLPKLQNGESIHIIL